MATERYAYRNASPERSAAAQTAALVIQPIQTIAENFAVVLVKDRRLIDESSCGSSGCSSTVGPDLHFEAQTVSSVGTCVRQLLCGLVRT